MIQGEKGILLDAPESASGEGGPMGLLWGSAPEKETSLYKGIWNHTRVGSRTHDTKAPLGISNVGLGR